MPKGTFRSIVTDIASGLAGCVRCVRCVLQRAALPRIVRNRPSRERFSRRVPAPPCSSYEIYYIMFSPRPAVGI